jgi:hypothetical protein
MGRSIVHNAARGLKIRMDRLSSNVAFDPFDRHFADESNVPKAAYHHGKPIGPSDEPTSE